MGTNMRTDGTLSSRLMHVPEWEDVPAVPWFSVPWFFLVSLFFPVRVLTFVCDTSLWCRTDKKTSGSATHPLLIDRRCCRDAAEVSGWGGLIH